MRPHPTLSAMLFVASVHGAGPAATLAQDFASDPLAAHLVGEWSGRGTYQGNELTLTRSWTLELGGSFLRADMRVSMPNGASFGGLTYWKAVGESAYQVVWMDGTGRMQILQARRIPESGVVGSDYVDEFTEDGAQPRRWEFEATGPDSYLERLFHRSDDGLELLTEWRFERVGAR